MYRLTVLFGWTLDDAQAEHVADEVATLCDTLVGRPTTDDDNVTYMLLWEPNVDDDDHETWLKENVFREGIRGVIIPRPWAEGTLQ